MNKSYQLFFAAETTLPVFWDGLVGFVNTISGNQYRSILGDENLKTINDYYINIRGKVQGYRKESRIGNLAEAQREENSALQVAGEMMRELREILLGTSDIQSVDPTFYNIYKRMSLNDHAVTHNEEKRLQERDYDTFLSCKSTDKAKVDHIYHWLKDVAGISVLYDIPDLPSIVPIESVLPEAIAQCRSIILILSRASIANGWIEREYKTAKDQQSRFKEFRIVPIRIEDCDPPDFMLPVNCIDVFNRNLDLDTANQLLVYLYHRGMGKEFNQQDIYISRTWHKDDADLANYVCDLLIKFGFRLIGDLEGQQVFYRKDAQERIKSIMLSCGAFVSILPDRGGVITSDPMLREIEIALQFKLPYLIVAEPTVKLPDDIDKLVLRLDINTAKESGFGNLQKNFQKLRDEWRTDVRRHYVFFATDFSSENNKRKTFIKEHIERITAMPCQLGQNVMGDEAQKAIIEGISNALIVIADILDDNENTLVEAGVARGSGVKLHPLLKKSSNNSRPPFMLSDLEVEPYSDDLELMGLIHRIAYKYRRRVLNYELPS